MARRKVLFVCAHNSARSQMAEAFIKQMASDRFEVESAGLEAGTLNPLAVEVMKEAGIDISGNSSDSVFEFFQQGRRYHCVITVCDEAQKEQCPVFPNTLERLHWSFEDPSGFEGTWEEKLNKTRRVRDALRTQIREWLETMP